MFLWEKAFSLGWAGLYEVVYCVVTVGRLSDDDSICVFVLLIWVWHPALGAVGSWVLVQVEAFLGVLTS